MQNKNRLTDHKKTKLSKYLSFLLRHNPQELKLSINKEGFVKVSDLLNKIPNLTLDNLKEIVELDDKGRFQFSLDFTQIRAVQGHTSDLINRKFEEKEPPEFLYHGTVLNFLNSIKEEGLKPFKRHYVHLSKDIATATNVGSRRGTPHILKIKAKEMFEDGYKFYLAENQVWLTKNVPNKYIDFNCYIKPVYQTNRTRTKP